MIMSIRMNWIILGWKFKNEMGILGWKGILGRDFWDGTGILGWEF